MPKPNDPKLYEQVKKMADQKYKKHSAYKSGWIVKTYTDLGGTYKGKKPKNEGLDRWFNEEWKDYAGMNYPVYRPTKRVTKETPLTPKEIDPNNLLSQAVLKQVFRGKENLPPFIKDLI